MSVHIGRRALVVMAAQAAGAALGYVGLLVIGRYVEAAAYGSYLLAFTWIGLLAFLSTLGFGQAHQRHLSTGTDVDRALGVFVRLRLLLALAVVVVTAAAVLVWHFAGGELTDATTPKVLLIAVAIHVVNGVRYVAFETWTAQSRVQRVEAAKLVDTVVSVVAVGLGGLMLAHLQGRWSPAPGIGAALARLFGFDGPLGIEATALLLAVAYLAGKVASLVVVAAWWLGDAWHLGPWDRLLAASYWRYALPVSLSTVITLILTYTDVTLLGYYWTSREVGLYGVAQRLSSLCLVAATAVSVLLFPRFARLHAEDDKRGIVATYRRAERYLLLVTVPPAVAFIALPEQILHVAVGDRYLASADALRILAAWALVSTAATPATALLLAEGRLRETVRASLLNAGLNVVLNLLLIPRFGADHAALAASVSTLVSTTGALLYLRFAVFAHHRVLPVDLSTLRFTLAALAAWAAWHYGPTRLGLDLERVYGLLPVLAAGAAVFAVALLALGEVRRDDWRMAREVLSPANYRGEFDR